MAAPQELSQAWDRLTDEELDCVEVLSVTVRPVSTPMADFLKSAVASESGHRSELKTKPRQVPDFESWTDRELADSYMASITIEGASAVSPRLHEWASMLLHSVCLHMATRLEVRHLATEVKRCDTN